MADNVIARKSGNWNAFSTLPSVNKTPMGGLMLPVPYPVYSPLSQSQGTIGSVKANSNTVWGFDDTKVPTTIGDAPGSGTGVKSGTVGKDSWPQEKSSTVKADDRKVVRQDDKAEMEGDKEAKEKEEMKKRQECREEQVKAGQKSANAEIRARAERFSQNISAAQYARLSNNVYGPNAPVRGWINESNNPAYLRSQGINQSDLSGPGAYRAQVYRPDPAVWGNSTRFGPTVAFQGTTGVFNGDVSASVGQGLRFQTDYYNRALSIGRSTFARGSNVTFTGHSLGGGLASAAATAGGGNGTTFNAAGLHSSTVTGYGGQVRPTNIDAYRVDNEPLTGTQEQGWKGTLGAGLIAGPLGALGKVALSSKMPDAIGTPRDIPATSTSPVGKHGMGDVKKGIEKQKQEDQKKIEEKTGKKC
jgi:hypothetical protein